MSQLDTLRTFDVEPPQLKREVDPAAGMRLCELPLKFAPTYMRVGSENSAASMLAEASRSSSAYSSTVENDEPSSATLEADGDAAAKGKEGGKEEADGESVDGVDPHSGVRLRYGPKRCPAWTDRVLMDGRAMAAVEASGLPAKYDSMPQSSTGPVPCDHDLVYLAFSLHPQP